MLINRIVRLFPHSKILTFYGGIYRFSQNKSSFSPENIKNIPKASMNKDANGSNILNMGHNNEKALRENQTSQENNSQIGGHLVIREGKAKVFEKEIFKDSKDPNIVHEKNAFYKYNSAEIMKRDISSLAFQTYGEILQEEQGTSFKGLRGLDAPAGSGLKTMRYINETTRSLIHSIHACNPVEESFNDMMKNFELNKIEESKVQGFLEDPNSLLLNQIHEDYGQRYNFIDLDPHGSSLPYLDNAIQAIEDGGLLAVTFGDMTVFASPAGYAKCFYMYGISRTNVPYYQEIALRGLLHVMNSTASRYGKYIKPMLSVYTDHIRLYVRVYSSEQEAEKAITKSAHVYACTECHNYHIHPIGKPHGASFIANPIEQRLGECSECNSPMTLTGPIWIGPLNNTPFVQKIYNRISTMGSNLKLGRSGEVSQMLHGILCENENENILSPLSIHIGLISKFFKTSAPNFDIISMVAKRQGFFVTVSYLSPHLLKSNAPLRVFYDFFKQWRNIRTENNRLNANGEVIPGTPVHFCLEKPILFLTNHKIKSNKAPKTKGAPESRDPSFRIEIYKGDEKVDK